MIVGPPDFAPPVGTTTTLYDVFRQRAVDTLGLKPPDQPSFTKDIYPILARTLALQWVSQAAGRMHNFLSAVIPPNDSEGTRKMVFERLRNPAEPLVGDMPMLFADSYDSRKKKNDPPNEPNETVTRLQYAMLKQWSEGDLRQGLVGVSRRSRDHTRRPDPGGARHVRGRAVLSWHRGGLAAA